MSTAFEELCCYCNDFIESKHAGGIGYERQEIHLRKFLDFCADYPIGGGLIGKEAVTAWNSVRGTEDTKTRTGRVTPVRQFAEYLNKRGIPAYVAPKVHGGNSGFVPYIFTNGELARLFTAADNRRENVIRCPNKHYALPAMIRTIYACGLRRSEVVKLRVRDVDLDDGILTILNSKFGKDRLIPIHPEFKKQLQEYSQKELGEAADQNSPFFPTSSGHFYNSHSVYGAFRKFLEDAGISHGGKDKGPRLHDLRHTFSVNCLKKWVREGNDINAAVPYLAAYLGHTHFRHSQVYLRLTADMFPDIIAKIEQKFDVFPVWEGSYDSD